MLTKSSLIAVAILATSIALLLMLLMIMLVQRQKASGRPLTDLIGGFVGRAKSPLRSLLIAIAFIVLLDYIFSTPPRGRPALVAFLAVFSALAIAPPWLPSFRLFAIATVAFCGTSFAAVHWLLPENAEGPEAMGAFLLVGLFYLLFIASCVVRLVCKVISWAEKQRSKNQQPISRSKA